MILLISGLLSFFWFYKQIYFKLIYEPKEIKIPSKKQISMVTFNIQKFPWTIKRINPIANIVSSYDIVLLQECFMVSISTLKKLFPNHWICKTSLSSIKLLNSGLVILSKYPITSAKFYPFVNSNIMTTDYLCEKGTLIANIKINNKTVQIINLHLQSSHYKPYDLVAIKQFSEIKKYIDYKKNYIIGGDFNVDQDDFTNLTNIKSLNYPSEPTIYVNFKTGDSICYSLDSYCSQTYDYFISTIDLVKPKTIMTKYSDHLPVETQFDL